MSSKSPCDISTYTLQQAICGMDYRAPTLSFTSCWECFVEEAGRNRWDETFLQLNDVSWGIAAVQRFCPIKPYRHHAGGELWAFLASYRL